jgi:hypothetical protein
MSPAPTGLRSFLKGPREPGIGGCLINVTGPDGITIFPTLLYDVHYSIDPILNVLER